MKTGRVPKSKHMDVTNEPPQFRSLFYVNSEVLRLNIHNLIYIILLFSNYGVRSNYSYAHRTDNGSVPSSLEYVTSSLPIGSSEFRPLVRF